MSNSASTIRVCETFVSIQGESTYAGLSCFFIRTAGCNLACGYCDTPQSKDPGYQASVSSLVGKCVSSRAAISEITGGEPLIQPGVPRLAAALRDRTGKPVLIETNGSLDISLIPDNVIAVMDIKTPGSGEAGKMDMSNITRLRPYDEVKFVITDRKDYEWARRLVKKHKLADLCHAVLFSPASGALKSRTLGAWIVKDWLPVRLHLQLHKLIGAR